VTAVEKPVKTRKTRIPTCIWRKITGQHVLDQREMPTKYLPIIRVVGNQWIVEGKPIVSGIVRNAKDAVRMYNYNASMEVELNALAPRRRSSAMAEQIEGHEDMWRNANRVNYAFLYNAVYDEATGQIVPVPPPQRAQPAMPQAAIISAKLAAADDIKKTTGQYDPSLGNNPQSKSGIALQREQVKSDVGTFHYVDNLARALRYAGTIIVDMIPRVYTGKRIARILGEDGEPDHVVLDPTRSAARCRTCTPRATPEAKAIGKVYNLGVGKYDVVVTTGPSFTTKRQEASEFLTNAIQSAKTRRWRGADLPRAQVERLGRRRRGDRDGEEAACRRASCRRRARRASRRSRPRSSRRWTSSKQAVGQAHGQLEAAKQALAERDATMKDLQGQLKGKNVEAWRRCTRPTRRPWRGREGARRGDDRAGRTRSPPPRRSPENAAARRRRRRRWRRCWARWTQKIAALAASTQAIAEQLQSFEIALPQPAGRVNYQVVIADGPCAEARSGRRAIAATREHREAGLHAAEGRCRPSCTSSSTRRANASCSSTCPHPRTSPRR
jgi:hypothetical protein